ncbi:hypothetical protein EJ110_NYTH33705 [Nymphaea thermarum]|nr:hypothetical protein EJ110_NYTH33705 [Nymphaea thermarum]
MAALHVDLLLSVARRRLWQHQLSLITAAASGISLFVVLRRLVSDHLRLSLCKTPLSQPAPPDGLPPPVRPDVSAAARRSCLCLSLRRWTVCLSQRRPTPLSQSPVASDSADVASSSARRCCIYLSRRRLSVPPRRLLHLTSALLTSSLPAPATLCSATTSFCSGSGDLIPATGFRRPDSGDLVCSTPCYWFFLSSFSLQLISMPASSSATVNQTEIGGVRTENIPMQVINLRLTKENYFSWSPAMTMGIAARDRMTYIDGSNPEPARTSDIANEVLHKESAKDMWDSLAATYSQARNETRIMQLHHDIHQMRQDGRPLHTYYSSLKSMFERLNSYFPACKCEQQKAYRDMLMVGVFLSGLDSVYESAKNQMLTSPSIPPIDETYSRLSRIPIPASTVPDTTSAMLATRGRGESLFARGRGGCGRGNMTSRPVCQFCHRIGHTVDKCWQKHGRPAFANQTVSTDSPEQLKAQHTASSSELRVDDIISQLRNLIGDRPQHALDPTTSTITTVVSASSSGMYSAYTVCPATDTTDWLIDSGASTHLCGDKTQFTSYVPTPLGRSFIPSSGLS